MTIYSATSDDKVVKLTIFCFQCVASYDQMALHGFWRIPSNYYHILEINKMFKSWTKNGFNDIKTAKHIFLYAKNEA